MTFHLKGSVWSRDGRHFYERTKFFENDGVAQNDLDRSVKNKRTMFSNMLLRKRYFFNEQSILLKGRLYWTIWTRKLICWTIENKNKMYRARTMNGWNIKILLRPSLIWSHLYPLTLNLIKNVFFNILHSTFLKQRGEVIL